MPSQNNLSTISLLLIATAALIAAFFKPASKEEQANSADNGTIRLYSCSQAPVAIVSCCWGFEVFDCHHTMPTLTTSPNGIESFLQTANGRLYQTIDNTSNSIANNSIDTTSMLMRAS